MTKFPVDAIKLAKVDTLPRDLSFGLRGGYHTLILDVRAKAAFRPDALGVPEAVPVFLDDSVVMLPDIDRETPILVYCSSAGQRQSWQVAQWLSALGYEHLWIMEGGLPEWNRVWKRTGIIQISDQERVSTWIAGPDQVRI